MDCNAVASTMEVTLDTIDLLMESRTGNGM